VRHLVAIIAALAWFALNGLLWFVRPPDLLWLFGSLALASAGFAAFFWYVMRE
jgi:hypothetical protein